MTNIGRIVGLIVGIALAAAAMLAPQAAIDSLGTTLGLDRLTPLAQPPLGQTARLALAAVGLLLGLLLAFVLGRLTRRTVDDPYANNDPLEMRHEPASWQSPAGSPMAAIRPGLEGNGFNAEPLLVDPGAAQPEIAQVTRPVPEPAQDLKEHLMAQEAMLPRCEPDNSPVDAPLHVGGPITVDPTPMPVAPTPEAVGQTAHDPTLAAKLDRVEAAIALLGQRGPAHLFERLDAIDARMGQIAQQIAELAGLARTAARTPAPAAPAPIQIRPPDDGARRQSIGSAARALRDRMDRDAGSDTG